MLSGLTSQLGGLTKQAPREESAAPAGPSSDPDGGGVKDEPTVGAAGASTVGEKDGPAAINEGSGDAAAALPSATGTSWLSGVSENASQMLASGLGLKGSAYLPPWFGGVDSEATTEVTGSESEEPIQERGRIAPNNSSVGFGSTDETERELILDEDMIAAGLEKVKSLGMSLFTSIKEAGLKIKDTNFLTEFQREQESFLKSRVPKKTEPACAPWIGHCKEETLKKEIISLSTDQRNFIRSPPSGVSFEWEWEAMSSIAKAIIQDDPNLEKMRFDLVPKVVTEENFWRNYFYRVMLLKESMSEDPTESGKKKAETEEDKKEEKDEDTFVLAEEELDIEKELDEELKSFVEEDGDICDSKN